MHVTVNYIAKQGLKEYVCMSNDPDALIEEAMKAKPNDEVLVGDGVIIIRRPPQRRR